MASSTDSVSLKKSKKRIYYKKLAKSSFAQVNETPQVVANTVYEDLMMDQLQCDHMLAMFYLKDAQLQTKVAKRKSIALAKELQKKINSKIINEEFMVGFAQRSLVEGNYDKAINQYNRIFSYYPNSIGALLGYGNIAYIKKDFETALASYKKAFRLNQNCSPNIRLLMGHCFSELNNYEKARLAYERSIEVNPECVESIIALAILDLKISGLDSNSLGIEVLAKVYKMDSSNSVVLNHLANYFFLNKDYKRAILNAHRASENTNNDRILSDSWYQIARAFHIQNQYNQAFEFYLKSVQTAPSSFLSPYYGLGQMYIYRKEYQNAIRCFTKLKRLMPQNFDIIKMIGLLSSLDDGDESQRTAKLYLECCSKRTTLNFEIWIRLAQVLQENNKIRALKVYQIAKRMFVTSNPNQPIPIEITNNIAVLNYYLGNYQISALLFNEILNTNSPYSRDNLLLYENQILYNWAMVNEKLFNYELSINLYNELLTVNPAMIECRLRLGCMQQDRGYYKKAIKEFKIAVYIDPNNKNARILLGNAFHLIGDLYRGNAQFEEILKTDPKDSTSLITLGNYCINQLMESGNLSERRISLLQERGLILYREVLPDDKYIIYAKNGVGCILAQSSFINEAYNILNEIYEKNDDFSCVWLNLGNIYFHKNCYFEAIYMFEQYIQKNNKENNSDIYMNIANAYFLMNEFNDARVTLLKALHIDPTNLKIMYNLAVVLMEIGLKNIAQGAFTSDSSLMTLFGQIQLAQKYLECIINKDPDASDAMDVKKYCDAILEDIEAKIIEIEQNNNVEFVELIDLTQPYIMIETKESENGDSIVISGNLDNITGMN